MAGDIAVTEASVTTIQDEKSATSRPSQIGFEMDSDFDADAYREEMINLVYDRSFDRLVKWIRHYVRGLNGYQQKYNVKKTWQSNSNRAEEEQTIIDD